MGRDGNRWTVREYLRVQSESLHQTECSVAKFGITEQQETTRDHQTKRFASKGWYGCTDGTL